jgi:anti-sigma factor RsiW
MAAEECEFAGAVDAYHDGELSPDRRERFEAHLAGCAACALELKTLRTISARLASAGLSEVPAGVLGRLLAGVPRRVGSGERAILRIAGALTTAAAAVLLFGLVGLFRSSRSDQSRMTAWEQAAVTLQIDTLDSDMSDATVGQDPTRLVAWTSDDFTP